jgi:hypothetical protein
MSQLQQPSTHSTKPNEIKLPPCPKCKKPMDWHSVWAIGRSPRQSNTRRWPTIVSQAFGRTEAGARPSRLQTVQAYYDPKSVHVFECDNCVRYVAIAS